MNIIDSSVPFRVTLFGHRGVIKDRAVHATAKPLLDKVWKAVHDRRIKTKGINHFVHLPESTIFTGVELKEPASDLGTLEALDISLDHYVSYQHVGPYSALGGIWTELMETLRQRGDKPQFPNLEIYGHWNENEAKCETTIVVGLAKRK